MSDKKWRFISRYSFENGLDTSDMETFKKDPYASLAREIAQNSIDAALGNAPVRIDFQLFDIPKESVPGYSELEAEINKTWEYVADDNKDKKPLAAIRKSIQKDTIKCLRISDFNTKGLVGASTNAKGTPFYNLTKGSGVSDKGGTDGGSKGIGKFATFVASTTNTVFYSTVTVNQETGNIGICKLRSRQDGDDPDMLTEGIGYYAIGDRNAPIDGPLDLDPGFKRSDGETGTDIFIIGFKDRKGWKDEITAKVLESFMVAITDGRLEVHVDDVDITKETVASIIFDSGLMSNVGKKLRKDVEAQYELLSETEDAGVFSKDMFISEENKVTVYVKQYSSKNSDRATKHCVMVRYPYMKINYTRGYSFLPYSALCIIHKNELNKRLRDIENPQHTDWEIKRLDEEPQEKKITKALKKELENAIDAFIEEVLQQTSSESTDLEGAGEFLPAFDEVEEDNESGSVELDPTKEEISATPPQRVTPTAPRTVKTGTMSESYEFGEGGEGEGTEGKEPGGSPTPPNPNPDPVHEPREGEQIGDGDSSVLVKTQLSGMKYHLVVIDKKTGRYNIVFTSAHTEDKCELVLRQYGADADKYPVEILSASVNGDTCEIESGRIINLSLKKDVHYTIECEVGVDEMFSSEVILYAYR
ncbi:MAG: hypothetical protein I3I98_04840 [Mobilibacterium timonense]|uniref:hypothetical protein n=1 Tax=Mobilibacterium timonense TaxID=1871012 RepID=UPI0023541F26|nr:hypothetical protein [Mobilibacterium timonense]MBM6990719.1 hypothetical protein [Mobilibacterium timonense]